MMARPRSPARSHIPSRLQAIQKDQQKASNVIYSGRQGQTLSPTSSSNFHELCDAHSSVDSPSDRLAETEHRWSVPAQHQDGRKGAVVRDAGGGFIFAACSPLPNCDDAEEAEARAALLGLKITSHHTSAKVILELDSSTMAASLHSKCQDR
jgi:hypothetical protein